MSFFSSIFRRKKKTAPKAVIKKRIPGIVDESAETHGYDPYDTLPGVSREKFGMRRQDDDKWSF